MAGCGTYYFEAPSSTTVASVSYVVCQIFGKFV
jgi:hypothetical protein